MSWDRGKLVEYGNRRDRILFTNVNSAFLFHDGTIPIQVSNSIGVGCLGNRI